MLRFVAMLCAAIVSVAADAEIYKCLDATGNTQFSDRPCAANAEKVILRETNTSTGSEPEDSSAAGSPADYNDTSELDREIATLDQKLDRMDRIFDKKIKAFQTELSNTSSTSSGLDRKEIILLEMQILNNEHSADALPLARKIGILKNKRDAIQRRANIIAP